MVRALVVTRDESGSSAGIRDLTEAELGDEAVLVEVLWSSLNYKDGLALAGNPGVARVSPLVPGIDVVGRVLESADARCAPGDEVVLTGSGLGETRHGGYAERARVPGELLVRVPEELGARRAAAIGTAGFTAAQAVLALERHAASAFQAPDGPVLVTGASGGVGTVAVALLAASGREVVASTGRASEAERLRRLGASEVVDRAELAAAGAPLQRMRWAAAIDSVGGATLANVLAQTRSGGTVAACGLAASADLPTSVHPFILRAVALLGINSVDASLAEREAVWARLARDLDPELLDASSTELRLDDVIAAGPRILAGEIAGRTLVRVAG
ncbi:MAG: oxidoreductase [Micrococcales bacterium]|nr:oxidoreductase [Micrococcales bacterium]